MPYAQESILEKSKEPPAGSSDEPPSRTGIRPARVSDLAQIEVLEKRSFTSDRFSSRTLRALATRPSSEMWVADCAGQVMGYAATLFRSNSSVARVYGLCVAQAARGRGIGRKLLSKAEKGARRRGCRAIRLEVRSDNRAALALYKASRYAPIRALPGYYADGCDGIRLQKTLVHSPQQGRKP